jgi:hypothetical protein
LLHIVPKDKLANSRGFVGPERRRQILATMARANEWL